MRHAEKESMAFIDRADTLSAKGITLTIPDELTADMTGTDIVFVLRDLRFSGGFRTIKLDRDARNYLLDSVLARIGGRSR
jgi:hypothetical protein